MTTKILKLFFFTVSLFVNVTLAIWTFYIGRSPYERLIHEMPNDFSKIRFVDITTLWQLYFFGYHRNFPYYELVNSIVDRSNLIKIKLKPNNYVRHYLTQKNLLVFSPAFNNFQIHNERTKPKQEALTFIANCKMKIFERRVKYSFHHIYFYRTIDFTEGLFEKSGLEKKGIYKKKMIECEMEDSDNSYKYFCF